VNGYLAGNLSVIEELLDGLAALVKPLDEACLNWTPPTDNANSIADLTAHILGSIEAWLARALAEPFERNRDAEFETHADAATLLAAIEGSRQRIKERLARLDGIDPAVERNIRRLNAPGEVPISVGWCIAHAVIHAGEHWGQIQLTQDLYEQSQTR
jgi:uncharacterized damage-inducible protein DinB